MGGTSVVLLADEPDAGGGRGLSHLRRLDAQGTLGPVRSIGGRRFVAEIVDLGPRS